MAGADRITLNDHLAIQDLLALGQFILLPEDDLALACLLKSPLVSHPKGAPSMMTISSRWRMGAARKACGSASRRRRSSAHRGSNCAGGWRSHASADALRLLQRGPDEGTPSMRQRMLSRLGPEAVDLLDAFLNLALDYERQEAAVLCGLPAWFTAADTEISRDMDQGGRRGAHHDGAWRQGPRGAIVFLPDTCAPPDTTGTMSPSYDSSDEVAGHAVLAVRQGGVESQRLVALEARSRRDRMKEYRRQLYVAMTRARDELYICGHRIADAATPNAGTR